MFTIPENIKAIIFDCDGTLVDTMPIHRKAWKEAFEKSGREFPAEFIDSLKGAAGATIVKYYNDKFEDTLNPEEILKFKAQITKNVIHSAKPIIPVIDVAKKYKDKLPMAVASGGSRYNVESSLAAVGLGADYFDVVLTSMETTNPKPDPEIFLKSAEAMNVAPEDCIVFEDGDFGIEAAKQAGMEWIDVREFIGDEYIVQE